jgi:hypothetical protein
MKWQYLEASGWCIGVSVLQNLAGQLIRFESKFLKLYIIFIMGVVAD